jgi:hypothetical protein
MVDGWLFKQMHAEYEEHVESTRQHLVDTLFAQDQQEANAGPD